MFLSCRSWRTNKRLNRPFESTILLLQAGQRFRRKLGNDSVSDNFKVLIDTGNDNRVGCTRRQTGGGTVHWADAQTAVDAQVRLYDNLFTVPDPDAGDKNFLNYVNPQSLITLDHCKAERSVLEAAPPKSFQFMRLGYFCLDSKDTTPQKPVFNRSVSLKDGFKGRK